MKKTVNERQSQLRRIFNLIEQLPKDALESMEEACKKMVEYWSDTDNVGMKIVIMPIEKKSNEPSGSNEAQLLRSVFNVNDYLMIEGSQSSGLLPNIGDEDSSINHNDEGTKETYLFPGTNDSVIVRQAMNVGTQSSLCVTSSKLDTNVTGQTSNYILDEYIENSYPVMDESDLDESKTLNSTRDSEIEPETQLLDGNITLWHIPMSVAHAPVPIFHDFSMDLNLGNVENDNVMIEWINERIEHQNENENHETSTPKKKAKSIDADDTSVGVKPIEVKANERKSKRGMKLKILNEGMRKVIDSQAVLNPLNNKHTCDPKKGADVSTINLPMKKTNLEPKLRPLARKRKALVSTFKLKRKWWDFDDENVFEEESPQ